MEQQEAEAVRLRTQLKSIQLETEEKASVYLSAVTPHPPHPPVLSFPQPSPSPRPLLPPCQFAGTLSLCSIVALDSLIELTFLQISLSYMLVDSSGTCFWCLYYVFTICVYMCLVFFLLVLVQTLHVEKLQQSCDEGASSVRELEAKLQEQLDAQKKVCVRDAFPNRSLPWKPFYFSSPSLPHSLPRESHQLYPRNNLYSYRTWTISWVIGAKNSCLELCLCRYRNYISIKTTLVWYLFLQLKSSGLESTSWLSIPELDRNHLSFITVMCLIFSMLGWGWTQRRPYRISPGEGVSRGWICGRY